MVTGSVNPGAEVLADESIYILGHLRGRAFAGCGKEQAASARVVSGSFDAELVSISTVYATIDFDFDVVGGEDQPWRREAKTMISLSDGALHFETVA